MTRRVSQTPHRTLDLKQKVDASGHATSPTKLPTNLPMPNNADLESAVAIE